MNGLTEAAAGLWGLLVIYLLIINLAAFFLYGIDKRRARKNKWRIPEKTLLMIAALGGSVGALLGMTKFRHKTQKWKFKLLVPLCLILQVVLLVYLGFGR